MTTISPKVHHFYDPGLNLESEKYEYPSEQVSSKDIEEEYQRQHDL